MIQSASDNLKGSVDHITNVYDFTGKVLFGESSHGVSKITWQNVVGVKVDGDNLVKTSSGSWGTSGASSVEKIPANTNGWIEATAGELVTRRMFSLSPQDRDQNFTSMKYALYLNAAVLTVYVNGSPVYTVPTGLATGDRLRIARENGYINFYQNGIKVYPKTVAQLLPSSEELLVDVALGSAQGYINKLHVSAGQEPVSIISRRLEYDHAGRLLKTWHKLNDGAGSCCSLPMNIMSSANL